MEGIVDFFSSIKEDSSLRLCDGGLDQFRT